MSRDYQNFEELTASDMRKQMHSWARRLSNQYQSGEAELSTHYMLPLLSVRGEPMTLKDHYMLKPMYRFPVHGIRPRRILWKTARQVGKTSALGSSDVLNHQIRKHWRSLTVAPLFEQIKKISTEVVRPMVQESAFKNMLQDKKSKEGVMERQFRMGGTQYFSHAFRDAVRIRSISGIDQVNIDECQHVQNDFYPIILETMSARPQSQFLSLTGTPLSYANPIESFWKKSTMSEWVIKCGCGTFNIPSVKHDLYKMTGKTTLVCKKCNKPLNPQNGTWISPVITHPKDLWDRNHDDFAGLHIPQQIHPLHCNYPAQWQELLRKMEGAYTPAKFVNEVCGESYDSAERMITVEELASACNGRENKIKEALRAIQKMDITGIGVDWSGGGEDTPSYTKVAVGGCLKNSLDVHIAYMETFPKHWPVETQVERIIDLFRTFRPKIISHDALGAGSTIEPFLLHMGIPQERLWNMSYTTAPTKAMMYYNNPQSGNRDCINLDRTRVLSTVYSMIKAKRLTFPDWNSLKTSHDPNVREVDDFLAMHGEEIKRPSGHDVYQVQTDPEMSDDHVHSCTFLATACWFQRQQLPTVHHMVNRQLTTEDLSNINPDLVEQESYTT